MSEPSKSDLEMARELFLRLGEGAPSEWLGMFAKRFAAARAEGRREAIEAICTAQTPAQRYATEARLNTLWYAGDGPNVPPELKPRDPDDIP